MIFGVISDTHWDELNALPHIIRRFNEAGVERIIHCGDIEAKHLKPELFGNLPVICALNEEQLRKDEFAIPPAGWTFTKPGERIVDLGAFKIYVGHKRSWEFLFNSEAELIKTLQTIRKDYDGVKYLFSGHTHHQIFDEDPLIQFVNPGAVEGSSDGYEFAIVDTEKRQITFSRIPKTESIIAPFSLAIISDSPRITEYDPKFWEKLADRLRAQAVSYVIHCGNIDVRDIGRPELNDFQVYYNPIPIPADELPRAAPDNWHLIAPEKPIVTINRYLFYVQWDLGASLFDQSERDMYKLCLRLKREYPNISYIFFGLTNDAFYEEGNQARLINPGDIGSDTSCDRSYAIIRFPLKEVAFSHIPADPLPPLE